MDIDTDQSGYYEIGVRIALEGCNAALISEIEMRFCGNYKRYGCNRRNKR